ncbi:hypothetical protein CONLIGDRAFT_688711 [Coniochaeta ligniaria NRRL 30616]|uniref:Sec20 C-terminal domain-containing protein n=1 Tax=Coniochaeta ligniaria NRRL 30616 TaxID=1408157 RepID=A0A1J7JXG0_9PEZI|nr:hypothetical protein CONLIGDRAFT_688711 [Coniochaeta ligniaria NRRL 30616]
MSFESLQDRLAALQETTSQLQDLINRLATLKFHPGSVPLDSSPESNISTELSTEIAQILREEEEDLELLSEEITDLRPGRRRPGSDASHVKARLSDGVSRLRAELTHARTAFRKAQLAARQSLAAAQRLERSLLLASYSAVAATSAPSSSGTASPQPQKHSQLFPPGYRPKRAQKPVDERESLVGASSSVTAALRRTHALISSELSRSQFAQQTLAESTAALEALQQHYSGLDDLLQSSRDLLGTLLTSNKSDTWYLETAFWMLAATLGWLVFRRWVYGPAWWLVWVPLRAVWGTGRGAVGLLGGRGGGAEVVEVGEVRGTEGARVGGLDERGTVAVPTVRTGRGEKVGVDEDSMVEKVGRMVDEIELQVGDGEGEGEAQELGGDDGQEAGQNKTEGEDAPNPMKRMWEEDKEALKEAAQEARIRDEL